MSPSGRIPRPIWVLGFVSLLMDMSSEMVHGLLPVFLAGTLGASMLVIGLIEGAGEALALVVKMFSGALSDWWGRRKPLTVLGYALAALSKPLFALAPSAGFVLLARLTDRAGKGIRGAPRDALIADLAPATVRGAAFGLRQSLDTAGAFLGPLVGVGLMLLWANDVRAVFWVAVIPAALAVILLLAGVQEPERRATQRRINPLSKASLKRLPAAYWWVIAIGALFTLARFSEAFLILRATGGGLPVTYAPLVLVAMNLVYAACAYPFGKLSDRVSNEKLLACGLVVLIAADLALAHSDHWAWVWLGISLWGLHMGMTQGLLARMVADRAPAELRGTAFGFFNLASGIALLLASSGAGLLWDQFGAVATFMAGALLSALALGVVLARRVWGIGDR